MECKRAEKLILHLLDGLLSREEKETLNLHLKKCPHCEERKKQYENIFSALKKGKTQDLLPNFTQRLMVRLRKKKKEEPLSTLKLWSLRVVPISLLLMVLLVSGIVFFLPGKQAEMSQTEVLLLQNDNPLTETNLLLEEKNVENKNMMLIFYTSDKKNQERRNFQ
ncbi:MAG: zf-HC2 domain-containing protein [Candidatus Aminicenantales bacterium]